MQRLFLDTNILIDILAKREPHHQAAIKLMILADQGEANLYCSAMSIATCDYILRKQLTAAISKKAIRGLLRYITVIPTTHDAVVKATKSPFADLEDAIQHFTAVEFGEIDAIITRNLRDYRHSLMPVRDLR
jgi:predicted nucleic acid-binding protein